MKVEKTNVTKLIITEAERLDPVHVFLEDIEPSTGRITINCYDQSWTAYWGAMSGRTVGQFFCDCDEHYLAKNLSSIRAGISDYDSLLRNAKAYVLVLRQNHELTKQDARTLFDRLNEHRTIERDCHIDADLMHEVFGDDWWYEIPEAPNPDYQYLCRIIKTVQQAIGGTA